MYVRKKIDPLYNCDGNIEHIVIHAMDLQRVRGVLTGQVNSMPDDYFRNDIEYRNRMNFLKKVANRIV